MIDFGGFGARRTRFERGRALFDAETAQKIHLASTGRGRGRPCISALCAKRLEIDMRGEVSPTRRVQRVCEGVSGDRLQSLTQAMGRMTVIDDQSGAVIARRAGRSPSRSCQDAIRRSNFPPLGAIRAAKLR